MSIKAIYQNGSIKPLEPVDLEENEQFEIELIRRQSPVRRNIVSLRGIWRDLPLPDEDEIDTALREIRAMTKRKLERMARELEEEFPDGLPGRIRD